ncbi:MAG: VOC family protein [Rhizobacter sp.]
MNTTTLDHLVIAASSLTQGVQWCEATLGITPGPGGVHTKMGTHNRLFSIAGDNAPGAYAEIIAIDPHAQPIQRSRWFGLDEPVLQAALKQGPQTVHAVVRTPQLDADLETWQSLGLDPGPAVAMSRATPKGDLHWRLTVRDDGQLAAGGCLPTLIEWPDVAASPGWRIAPGGVELLDLTLLAPTNSLLPAAYAAIGWRGVAVLTHHADAPHRWRATFNTPKGVVSLLSFHPG